MLKCCRVVYINLSKKKEKVCAFFSLERLTVTAKIERVLWRCSGYFSVALENCLKITGIVNAA